jgi:hypothetical protein
MRCGLEPYIGLFPVAPSVVKRLAAQVGAEAAEGLPDVLDHGPNGLLPDLY